MRLEPMLLIAWTMATAALAFSNVDHPIRTLFALVFVSFVPGLAIIRMAHFEGLAIRLLLAIPTSLSAAALVSAVLVYSGVPSWNLGLSALVSLTVGFVIADFARGSVQRETYASRRKLDDETRQEALVQAFVEGGTLSDAAAAAGVSTATLRRALRSSNRLRYAVRVATHGESDRSDLTSPDNADGADRAPAN